VFDSAFALHAGPRRWVALLAIGAVLAALLTGAQALLVPPRAEAVVDCGTGAQYTRVSGDTCYFETQSNGSWTKPSWVSTYTVNLVGGGGGGTAVYSTTPTDDPQWGNSGAAGALAQNASATASPISFTIGAGGSGGASLVAGGNGGSSTVSTLSLTATGGAGSSDGNWWNCNFSNPASHNGGRGAKPGPLSGTSWGTSGWGGISQNNGSCPTNGGPTSSNGEAGQAGGIQIIFSAAPAPQNTVAPSFTGTPAFKSPAEVLTGNQGTWNDFGSAATYTYLWQSQTACSGTWSDAAGSTKALLNYTIVSGDVGNCLRLQVTATNAYGATTATSSASLQVTAVPVFTASSPPVIADVGYAFNGAAGGYAFQASGGRITYSLSPSTYNAAASPTGLPASLTINASTGAVSGTPASGQAGVYTYLVVATNDSGSATTATLTLTVSSGTPAEISITTQPVGGMASGTALTTQPVVELKDSGGRLIAQPLAIVATSSGGTLGGTTSVTTSAGVATFTNLTLAGLVNTNYTLTFTRSSLTAVANAIQVTPGAVNSISITTQPVAGAASGSLLATQPVVRLLDAQGNLIDDRSSTVTVTSELAAGGAGGSVGGTTSRATSTGIATFTDLTFGGLVGTSYRLKFTSGAVTQLSSSIANTAAGAPAQLSVQTQPTLTGTQLVGSAFTTQPVVRILDAGGNTTTSTATVTATASGGTLGGTAAVAAVSGTATFSGLTFAGLVSTPYTLTFSSSGLTSATSSSFQFGAGMFGPVSTSVTTITASPTTRPADGTSTSSITVQAKDDGGNNLTTSQGTVALSVTSGALGAVTDNNNGTYSAAFTAPAERGAGGAVVSGTLAGTALSSTTTIGLFTTQTITFAQPANVTLGTLPYQLFATSTSGLPVSFSLGAGTTNSACTVSSAGIVTISAVGNCQIQADQAGDSTYWAAPQVVRTYAVAATTPTAPFITSVTEGNVQATVAFIAPGFNGGATITNYEWSTDGTTWTVLSPVDATSPVTIPGLVNGTAYTVSLRAVNSAGPGLASSASPSFTPRASGGTTVTATTTTPSAPRNAQSVSEATGAVTLSWQEPRTDGGATITSYTVSVSPAGTCSASIAASSRVGSCSVSGLTAGVTYTFTIQAVNSNGSGDAATVTYTVPGGNSGGGSSRLFTLTFEASPGTCTVSSVTASAGSWVALPNAAECEAVGVRLTGWQPLRSSTFFVPGSSVQVTGNNTLRALWESVGVASETGTQTTTQRRIRLVVWSDNGRIVRVGKSNNLAGQKAVFSIVTRDARKVTPAAIAAARALAAEHGGVYVGVVRGDWWVTPRIVAAYRS
jgi:large repetitive protein